MGKVKELLELGYDHIPVEQKPKQCAYVWGEWERAIADAHHRELHYDLATGRCVLNAIDENHSLCLGHTQIELEEQQRLQEFLAES